MREIEQGSSSVSTGQDDAAQSNLCAVFESNIGLENLEFQAYIRSLPFRVTCPERGFKSPVKSLILAAH